MSFAQQPLTGRVNDADWRLAGGLARLDDGRWTIGLYPERVADNFVPTLSYVELEVPGPGQYRVDEQAAVDEENGLDAGWSARFFLCPADTPKGQCIGTNMSRRIERATAGVVSIVQSRDGGSLTVSGGARLEDGSGNEVDGLFEPLSPYEPICERNAIRCVEAAIQRCSWDQRSWNPVPCSGESGCNLEQQCSTIPISCDAGSRCVSSP